MKTCPAPSDLIKPFKHGEIFAYPTEAVYGLGCDPDNEQAVMRLLAVKQRPINKGLILIVSDFSQVKKYLQPLLPVQLPYTLPSDTTYIFPALDSAPAWLTGDFKSLAIRVTKHPIARELCQALQSAIISTSANLSGQAPAETVEQLTAQLGNKIDCRLVGALGESQKPSVIRDSLTGKVIRE